MQTHLQQNPPYSLSERGVEKIGSHTDPGEEEWRANSSNEALRYPPRRDRMSRPESRLVCGLINDRDCEFIGVLLAHVRGDTRVARAVFRGICRTPELLEPTAARDLLELLRHQGQPKYARNLAIEILRTLEFANSFELISKCAEVVSEHAHRLSPSQRGKIVGRAEGYPARTLGFRPWPMQDQHESSRGLLPVDTVDYGGAVSILLLSRLPNRCMSSRELLETAVRFARRHPQSENLWLDPLRTHAPEALRVWQMCLTGTIPRQHLMAGLVKAIVVTASPWIGIKVAFLVANIAPAPKPPAVALAVFVAGAAVWGFQIVLRTFQDVRRLGRNYAVGPEQASQILRDRTAAQ